jgi:DNA-binding XRE family transcriptional regulator
MTILLRASRALVPQLVNALHEVARANMQPFAEFQQVRVARVALTTHQGVDLSDRQAAIPSDCRLRHVLVLGDQYLDRLSERRVVWAEGLGLPFGWHVQQPALSSPRSVRKYFGYHRCRRLSTAEFAMKSVPDRQAKLQALGRTIRAIRSERGLDAKALAENTGVQLEQLVAIEDGGDDPEFDVLAKLADALSIGLGELFTKAEEVEKEDGDHA